MKRCVWLMAVAGASMQMLLAAEKPPEPVLKGFDPVAPGRGEEQSGKPELETLHEGLRYRFATPESRMLFLSDPERYGIQYDGACMRMGPLSGGGSPERWAVHDGRIYLFASDACRSTFQKSPERFVVGPEVPPTGTTAEARRGKELLDLAYRSMADGLAWRSLTSYRVRTRHSSDNGDASSAFKRAVTVKMPRLLALQEEHGEKGEYRGGWELRADGGYVTWGSDKKVGTQARAHMLREYHRQPVALLKAWSNGEVQQAFSSGTAVSDGIPIEWVSVHVEGATTRLGIDPVSGRILRAGYRGFGSRGVVPVERAYRDFRPVRGFTVPFGVTLFSDGAPVAGSRIEVLGVDINE